MRLPRSAEFPNDNPELHRGAIWVCRATVGPPEAEVRVIDEEETWEPPPTDVETRVPPRESVVVLARPPEGESEPTLADFVIDEIVVDEIVVEELDFDLSHVPVESGPPPPLETELPTPSELEDDAYTTFVRMLCEVAVAQGAPPDAVPALLDGPEASTSKAWRAVLRNETDDISACGSAMLDEWAADVVARATGAPGKASQLRRELRARGVCAFGLVDAA